MTCFGFSAPGLGNLRQMPSATPRTSVLFWNSHAAWTNAFASGPYRYVVAVDPANAQSDRGLDPRIRNRIEEVPVERLREQDVDLVVLQKPSELALVARWLGRRP